METAPIGTLDYPDKEIFGTNFYNLSQLKRLKFNVLDGIFISPPEIILETILKVIKEKDKEKFEQSLVLIKNEINKVPLPSDLKLKLKDHPLFFFEGKIYADQLSFWKKLLNDWLEEIRGRIWNLGFEFGISQNLSPKVAFYHLKEEFELGEAFFDPEKEETIINFIKKLTPKELNFIDQMVLLANKKLYLPQIYSLIKTKDKIYLTGLKPFTSSMPFTKTESIIIPKNNQEKVIKKAMKIFLDLANGFAIDKNIDGLLIETKYSRDFEELVFRLYEGTLSYPGKEVFLKLPDELFDHQKFDEACSAFLFVRNKKNLLNLELIIPKLNSINELLSIKRELAVKNINRKGSLKIWLEMAIPENFINAENYLESGLDGIFLDLDILQKMLIAPKDDQPDLAKIHVSTVIKFLKTYFKVFHAKKIPVIARGTLIFHPEILDFLIEKGCLGIIANTLVEAENLPEHLNFTEKRILLKK